MTRHGPAQIPLHLYASDDFARAHQHHAMSGALQRVSESPAPYRIGGVDAYEGALVLTPWSQPAAPATLQAAADALLNV